MANPFAESWKQAPKTIIGAVLSALVAGVLALGVAVYETAKDVALRTWVVGYVQAQFRARDQIAQIEDDIASLRTTMSKSENPEVIADLEARIEEYEARIEELRSSENEDAE